MKISVGCCFFSSQNQACFVAITLRGHNLCCERLISKQTDSATENSVVCLVISGAQIVEKCIIHVHSLNHYSTHSPCSLSALGMSPPPSLLSRILMPHASPQGRVSEAFPSPKSHPQRMVSEAPPSLWPHPLTIGDYPRQCQRSGSLPLQNRPPVIVALPQKSPRCRLLDRTEKIDHLPHRWGPHIKDTTQYRCINHDCDIYSTRISAEL